MGATAIGVPLILSVNIKGANDRVRVGVVGVHEMGQNHIKEYLALNNVEVVLILKSLKIQLVYL